MGKSKGCPLAGSICFHMSIAELSVTIDHSVHISGSKLRFAWYHPLRSPEANFRPGRKRKILDIFGRLGPSGRDPTG